MWQDIKDLISGTLTAVGMLLWVLFVVAILGGLGVGVYCLYQTTLTPAQLEAQRQADIAERTPHVYSKVDNCTVYIWKNGSYNSYFTKCDNTNKVVTEFSHSESCGKACTKRVDEKVETN
jgi:hypothetical protein